MSPTVNTTLRYTPSLSGCSLYSFEWWIGWEGLSWCCFLCFCVMQCWQCGSSHKALPCLQSVDQCMLKLALPFLLFCCLFVLIIGLNYIENVRKIGSVLCVCFVFTDSTHLPWIQPSQRTLNQSVSNGSVTLLNLKWNYHDYGPSLPLPSNSQKWQSVRNEGTRDKRDLQDNEAQREENQQILFSTERLAPGNE